MNTARVIFATYGMFSKGVDLPRLSAGIDCTPRSQAQQVHGRILRKHPGKLSPIWMTCLDINSYRTNYQFAQRIDEYQKSNANIYEWDFDKGIRKQDFQQLRLGALNRSSDLKTARIVQHRNGKNRFA